MNFSKFMVPKTFAKLILFNRLAQAEEGTPFLGPFFGIQCPTIFCDFGLFNRLAQAGGGGPYYMIKHYQKHTVLNYCEWGKFVGLSFTQCKLRLVQESAGGESSAEDVSQVVHFRRD